MNIYSERPIMIFKEVVKKQDGTTFTKYNASISRKKPNSDEYENASFPIEFMQGVELHHKTKISIAQGDAWLSFYKYQIQIDGETKNRYNFFVKCKKFEIIEGGQVENNTQDKKDLEINKAKINEAFAEFGDLVHIDNDNNYLD